MRTALVTTCWLGNTDYMRKMIKWINYYVAIKHRVRVFRMQEPDIFVLDNTSSSRNQETLATNSAVNSSNLAVSFVSFDEHFGRPAHLDYKYLWRAVYYFQKLFDQGYDKVIYMDNDFYVLTPKMIDFVNKATGWTSPWCARHNFPETGLQIVTADCQAYKDFMKDVKEGEYPHNGRQMEDVLPLTHVERGVKGDRYSEYGTLEQSADMDFMAQTLSCTFPIFDMGNL